MTLDEFFVELEKVKDQFDPQDDSDWIRTKPAVLHSVLGGVRDNYCFCPVSAVAKNIVGQGYFNSEIYSAAAAIKLAQEDALSLARAADRDCPVPHILDLRMKMLAIVRAK